MKKDRETICNVISYMLDNPDRHGIYPTSTAFTALEHYIEIVRAETIGWTHSYCCTELDAGTDPRVIEVPKIYEQAIKDLKK